MTPPDLSEKSLDQIFNRYIMFGWDNFKKLMPKLKKDIVSWATGHEEKRWCEHISCKEHECVYMQTAISPGALTKTVPYDWNLCPICGAKRPA